MAKVTITIKCEKCGEFFEHTAYKNTRREADEYEAWAKVNITVCPHCLREAKKAKALEATKGMTELTGTEKQVAWAEDIRAKFVNKCKGYYGAEDMEVINEAVNNQGDAKFWIDARNKDIEGMFDVLGL